LPEGSPGLKKDSLILAAYEMNVPIFAPAFSDSSAGFGFSKHQWNMPEGKPYVTLDAAREFLDLTKVIIRASYDAQCDGSGANGVTGLFMIGGGTPKNFAQDTVVNAELLGVPVGMHKYAIQLTVADVRDGGCSSSTLKEAHSWGKVLEELEQMVFAEATLAWPQIASYAYNQAGWRERKPRNHSSWLDLLNRPRDLGYLETIVNRKEPAVVPTASAPSTS